MRKQNSYRVVCEVVFLSADRSDSISVIANKEAHHIKTWCHGILYNGISECEI